jgi:hypothetical protein
MRGGLRGGDVSLSLRYGGQVLRGMRKKILSGGRIGGLLKLANLSNYMFFSLGMKMGRLLEML